MKKQILFLAILLMYMPIHINAQITFPTPNVAELGKYGQIPVDLFSGLAKIDIPVYSLKNKDIEVPINLSYHGGGIRTEQRPTWVGLGWNLSAGGSIIRIINSKEDELVGTHEGQAGGTDLGDAKFGYFYTSHLLAKDDWASAGVMSKYYKNVDYPLGSLLDGEPDEFMVVTPWISGSFYFYRDENQNLKVKFKSKDGRNIKVEVEIPNEISFNFYKDKTTSIGLQEWLRKRFYKFILTSEDGTKYTFGGNIDAIDFNKSLGIQTFVTVPSAWHLTEIVSPLNNKVVFNYKRSGSPIILNKSIEYLATYELDGSNITGDCVYGCQNNGPENNGISILIQHPAYLASISASNGGKIEFSTSKSNDLPYDMNAYQFYNFFTYPSGPNNTQYESGFLAENYSVKLDEININDKLKVKFNYLENVNERLKLKNLEFKNIKDNNHKLYEFKYNSLLLPKYNSKKSDNWGFYNNSFYENTDPATMYQFRSPNSELMKAETLTSIVYPTGGTTTFEYEPHDFSRITSQMPSFELRLLNGIAGGLRIKKIISKESSTSPELIKEYTYLNEQPITAMVDATTSANIYVTPSNRTNSITFTATRSGQLTIDPTASGYPGQTYLMKYSLSNGTGGTFCSRRSSETVSWGCPATSPKITINIPAGTYTMSIEILNSTSPDPYGGISFEYPTLKSEDFISSGILSGVPVYKATGTTFTSKWYGSFFWFMGEYHQIEARFLRNSENYLNLLGNTNGNHVTYSRVIETIPGLGKKVYKYTNHEDYPDQAPSTIVSSFSDDFSTTHFTSRELERGLLTSEEAYGADNLPRQTISYKYNSSPSRYDNYIKSVYQTTYPSITVVYPIWGSPTSFTSPAFTRVTANKIYTFYPYLEKKTITDYDSKGLNPVLTQKTYEYNSDYGSITAETQDDSNQGLLTTKYKYPYDFATSIYTEMTANHIISPVIERVVSLNNKQVSLDRLNFDKFNNLFLSKSTEKKIGDNDPFISGLFNKYDAKGNLLEYQMYGGPKIGYLWGYQSQYPIAKVTNVLASNSNAESFYEGFEENTALNVVSGIGHTGERYWSGNYTTNVNLNSARKYVIQWWSFANNQWNFNEQSFTQNMTIAGIIDDVRIFPEDAQMITYTYDPLIGMTSMTDSKGQTTYYEYDGFERLKYLRDQKRNIIKTNEYHLRN